MSRLRTDHSTIGGARRLTVTLALLLGCSSASVTFANPLDLDSGFGNGGTVVIPRFGPIPGLAPPLGFENSSPVGFRNTPVTIAVQSDGKIVLALDVDECFPPMPLSASCFPAYVALIRYNTDGSLDFSFGTDGVLINPGYSELHTLLVQADGKIVLEGYFDNSLLRLDASGSPDTSFGNAGRVSLPDLGGNQFLHFPLLQQGDRKLLVAGAFADASGSVLRVAVGRLNMNGSIDASYGTLGIAAVPVENALGLSATAGTLQSDGKIVVVGDVSYFPQSQHFVSGVLVARFNTDGTPDVTFADNGLAATSFPATPIYGSHALAVRQQANGKLLVLGVQPNADGVAGLALLQLNADGSLDETFGTSGRLITSLAGGSFGLTASGTAAWQSDGSAVFSGPSTVQRLFPDGSVDPGFGDCGTRQFVTASGLVLAVQPDDKLLVTGLVPDNNADVFTTQYVLARFRGDHSTAVFFTDNGPNPARAGDRVILTARIAGHSPVGATATFKDGGLAIPGCTAVPVLATGSTSGPGSYAATCTAQGLGLGTHVLTAHYDGEAANPEATSCPVVQFVDAPDSATAIEYYHAVFDHYFITTSSDEVAALDGGFYQGWSRTGQSFQVHPLDALAGSAPVCRFFSGQAFAPKSSHFFTPLAAECAAVQQNPDWEFEGFVFGLDLPSADGTCTSGGQVPLYRLYNNGQGGAPNHRYVTNEGARDNMVGLNYSWIPEGFGVGVIGCVPK